MVSLVNSARLKSGLPTLGWLNPSIYANNGGFTNDITSGNNKCTASYKRCCSIGFEATEGWVKECMLDLSLLHFFLLFRIQLQDGVRLITVSS